MPISKSVENHRLKPFLIDQIIILRPANELGLNQKVQFLHKVCIEHQSLLQETNRNQRLFFIALKHFPIKIVYFGR
jgi:hypothetical protein